MVATSSCSRSASDKFRLLVIDLIQVDPEVPARPVIGVLSLRQRSKIDKVFASGFPSSWLPLPAPGALGLSHAFSFLVIELIPGRRRRPPGSEMFISSLVIAVNQER